MKARLLLALKEAFKVIKLKDPISEEKLMFPTKQIFRPFKIDLSITEAQ